MCCLITNNPLTKIPWNIIGPNITFTIHVGYMESSEHSDDSYGELFKGGNDLLTLVQRFSIPIGNGLKFFDALSTRCPDI